MLYKFNVTGIVENNRGGYCNKSVIVKAENKIEAIDKGLKKLDTKKFVKCELIMR